MERRPNPSEHRDRESSQNISRRKFLSRGAAFGAALALSPREALSKPMHELSDNADVKEIAAFIRRHREPVDYAKIWEQDVPVLFIGERDMVIPDMDELIEHIPGYADMGMTHIVLERIHRMIEDDIDDKVEIRKLLQSKWKQDPKGWERYAKIIDSARNHDVRVISLGSERFGAPQDQNDIRFFGFSVASTLYDILKKEHNARILCYINHNYLGYHNIPITPNETLWKIGDHDSSVVLFAGGDRFAQHEDSLEERISTAAEMAKRSQERFSIRLDSTDNERRADYVIHLPQVG